MKSSIIFISFCVALGFFSACSNLLYYPTRTLYSDPKPSPIELHLELKKDLIIHGWHFKQGPKVSKGCVAFFHGNAQNRSSHFYHLYWLISESYDYYIFDYPGFGQTKGDPTPENTVSTAMGIIKYIANQNCKRMIVYGHSLGGQIAMRAAWEVREKVKIDLLVIDSSFLSYQDIGNNVLRRSALTWLISPLSYLLLSDKWAMEERIKDFVNIPLVVIHTKTDQVVPFKFGEEVYKKARGDKEFWIKEKGNHFNIYSDKKGRELKEKLLKRLSEI